MVKTGLQGVETRFMVTNRYLYQENLKFIYASLLLHGSLLYCARYSFFSCHIDSVIVIAHILPIIGIIVLCSFLFFENALTNKTFLLNPNSPLLYESIMEHTF